LIEKDQRVGRSLSHERSVGAHWKDGALETGIEEIRFLPVIELDILECPISLGVVALSKSAHGEVNLFLQRLRGEP
jgi:hypothetical protein